MSLNGDSMNKILLTFPILISFSFGQSGGQSFEKYLEGNMCTSCYSALRRNINDPCPSHVTPEWK